MRPSLPLALLVAACSFDPESMDDLDPPGVEDPGDPTGEASSDDLEGPRADHVAPEALTCPGDDQMEPNQAAAQARDLGTFYDELGADLDVHDLMVRDEADEDWFRFHVYDTLGLQNPRIVVELAQDAEMHTVEVSYRCDHGDDESVCSGVTEASTDLGVSCSARGLDPVATLEADCDNFDESGMAWVRVRRTTWDDRCRSYDLRVRVNR